MGLPVPIMSQPQAQQALKPQQPGGLPPDLGQAIQAQKLLDSVKGAQGAQGPQGQQPTVAEQLKMALAQIMQSQQPPGPPQAAPDIMAHMQAQGMQQAQQRPVPPGMPQPVAQPQPQGLPQAAPPQRMAGGGIVAFAEGGTPPTPAVDPKLQEILDNMPPGTPMSAIPQLLALMANSTPRDADVDTSPEKVALQAALASRGTPSTMNGRTFKAPTPDKPAGAAGGGQGITAALSTKTQGAVPDMFKDDADMKSQVWQAVKGDMDATSPTQQETKRNAEEERYKKSSGIDDILKGQQARVDKVQQMHDAMAAQRPSAFWDQLSQFATADPTHGLYHAMAAGTQASQANQKANAQADIDFQDKQNTLLNAIDAAKVQGNQAAYNAGMGMLKDLQTQRSGAMRDATQMVDTGVRSQGNYLTHMNQVEMRLAQAAQHRSDALEIAQDRQKTMAMTQAINILKANPMAATMSETDSSALLDKLYNDNMRRITGKEQGTGGGDMTLQAAALAEAKKRGLK